MVYKKSWLSGIIILTMTIFTYLFGSFTVYTSLLRIYDANSGQVWDIALDLFLISLSISSIVAVSIYVFGDEWKKNGSGN